MRLRIVALAVLPVLTTGCEFFNEPEQGRTGFVSFSTLDTGSGFALNPVAAFFGSGELDFSLAPAGACVTRPYVSDVEVVNLPSASTVDAGAFVRLDQPARSDSLFPVVQFDYRLYRATSGLIPIVPGDEITVTVPGGPGFPAVTLPIVTVEEFTIADPVVPAENQPLTITWSPPVTAGALMTVSLRYSRPDTPGITNEQLLCSFEDTGTGTIPASFLSLWGTAPEADREFSATRARMATVVPGANTRITLISTLTVPTPPTQ